jgi:hypothetical protein
VYTRYALKLSPPSQLDINIPVNSWRAEGKQQKLKKLNKKCVQPKGDLTQVLPALRGEEE